MSAPSCNNSYAAAFAKNQRNTKRYNLEAAFQKQMSKLDYICDVMFKKTTASVASRGATDVELRDEETIVGRAATVLTSEGSLPRKLQMESPNNCPNNCAQKNAELKVKHQGVSRPSTASTLPFNCTVGSPASQTPKRGTTASTHVNPSPQFSVLCDAASRRPTCSDDGVSLRRPALVSAADDSVVVPRPCIMRVRKTGAPGGDYPVALAMSKARASEMPPLPPQLHSAHTFQTPAQKTGPLDMGSASCASRIASSENLDSQEAELRRDAFALQREVLVLEAQRAMLEDEIRILSDMRAGVHSVP